jgi:hypothetical protein
MKLTTDPINCHDLEHKSSTSTLQFVFMTRCLTVHKKTPPLTLICEIWNFFFFFFFVFFFIVACVDLIKQICADIILLISILLSIVHRHNIFVCHFSYQYACLLAKKCDAILKISHLRRVFTFIWFKSIPYMICDLTKPNYKVRTVIILYR